MTATVIVIGAGPVGQTSALLLARWGLDVTLLDAAPGRTATGSRSICQQRDVLDIWSHIGARAVTTEGLTWTTAKTYHRGRPIHSATFPATTGTPPFVNLSQSRTETILDGLIASQPRITVHWDHPVTDVAETGHTVTVTTPHGTHHGDYAVLATGAHGRTLRERLGIDFPGTSYDDVFLITDVAADLDHPDERHFHFDPPGSPARQTLIHPCPGGTYRIDWQLDPRHRAVSPPDLRRLVRAATGTDRFRILWSTTYRFHSRVATRMATGRVLLAGDAAHLYAPFGARGLNSGIPDAENLAWKIAAHAHGWAHPDILDSYHGERHAAARENQEVVDTTMRFLTPHTDAQRHHREQVLRAAHTDPGAARHIDSGRFAEPYWYPESPLHTAAPHRPPGDRPPKGGTATTAPGAILPDPPEGTPSLRPRVRGRFTLITRDHADTTWFHRTTDAPTAHIALCDVDPTGRAADHLGIRPGEAWLTRPDAHLAATIDAAGPADVARAVRTALAHPD